MLTAITKDILADSETRLETYEESNFTMDW